MTKLKMYSPTNKSESEQSPTPPNSHPCYDRTIQNLDSFPCLLHTGNEFDCGHISVLSVTK